MTTRENDLLLQFMGQGVGNPLSPKLWRIEIPWHACCGLGVRG